MYAVANPATLRLVRQWRGLTQQVLTADLGRSGAYVCKLESEDRHYFSISGPDLDTYAHHLNVHPELLTHTIPQRRLLGGRHGLHVRSAIHRNRLFAHATLAAHALTVLIDTFPDLAPAAPLPAFIDSDLHPDPAFAACALRDHFRLGPDQPVPDPAGVLESAGVHVLPLPSDITGVRAATVTLDGPAPAVTFLNITLTPTQQRAALTLELAQLASVQGHKVATSADDVTYLTALAEEFLTPYGAVRDTLANTSPTSHLDALLRLSRTWGVHPLDLIRRTHHHADLSGSQRSRWNRALKAGGFDRNAHLPTHPTQPRRTRDYLGALNDAGVTPAQIAARTGLSLPDLNAIFGGIQG